MKNKKRLSIICVLIVLSFMFSGCTQVDKIKLKLGLKNNDFEYLKQGKVKKIIIQNNRDKGFKFIVSDKKTLSELYDILSTAKPVNVKTSLEPDYLIELQESPNKTVKFNYISGTDKKDAGNFYSEDKVFMVSKNIDTNIIKNFGVMNKPRNFKDIYYGSILQTIDNYKQINKKSSSLGVNLNDDINGAKYILSTELEEFKADLKKKGVELVDKNKKYDVVFNVSTQGYRLSGYKAIITVMNNNDNTEKKYYIVGKFKSTLWDIKLILDKVPKNF